MEKLPCCDCLWKMAIFFEPQQVSRWYLAACLYPIRAQRHGSIRLVNSVFDFCHYFLWKVESAGYAQWETLSSCTVRSRIIIWSTLLAKSSRMRPSWRKSVKFLRSYGGLKPSKTRDWAPHIRFTSRRRCQPHKTLNGENLVGLEKMTCFGWPQRMTVFFESQQIMC